MSCQILSSVEWSRRKVRSTRRFGPLRAVKYGLHYSSNPHTPRSPNRPPSNCDPHDKVIISSSSRLGSALTAALTQVSDKSPRNPSCPKNYFFLLSRDCKGALGSALSVPLLHSGGPIGWPASSPHNQSSKPPPPPAALP